MPSLAFPTPGGIEDIEWPQLSSTSAVGISVAIAGNVLISLALNLQKLAHRRLEKERAGKVGVDYDEDDGEGSDGAGEGDGESVDGSTEMDDVRMRVESMSGDGDGEETDLLIPIAAPSTSPLSTGNTTPVTPRTYGTIIEDMPLEVDTRKGRAKAKRRKAIGAMLRWETGVLGTGTRNNLDGQNGKKSSRGDDSDGIKGNAHDRNVSGNEEVHETDYLKSKLWWFGFLLMNVGELGNFISYAFAPASVVAPLGTFALIANCLFAPLLLGERFRKRDFVGITVAIIGAITVVLSSNTSDTRLSPSGLIQAITQRIFAVYSIVYIVGAIVLAGLSERREWVLVDVGLCALFGGFTVLATKGVSTLLTMEWIEMFTEWITYPIILVLIGTGVGQIKYLNRALMRYDSKVVIPVQFVLFNLSAILGSAILYSDFRRAKFHQFVTFLYGCGATFAGVWIIAWGPSSPSPSPTPRENRAENVGTDGGAVSLAVVGRPKGVVTSDGAVKNVAVVRPRQSTLSLVGISPAQRLLLVHTPPREDSPVGSWLDVERGHQSQQQGTPDSMIGRRRTVSMFGEEIGRRSVQRADGTPTLPFLFPSSTMPPGVAVVDAFKSIFFFFFLLFDALVSDQSFSFLDLIRHGKGHNNKEADFSASSAVASNQQPPDGSQRSHQRNQQQAQPRHHERRHHRDQQHQQQPASQQQPQQPKEKGPGAQQYTREVEMIVQEEREAKGRMPQYKGLERFKLIDKMGDGAFSNVYKAVDLTSGKKVAVKVVRKYELTTSQRANILKEVQIMRTISHPSIVKLLSFSENAEHYFLVLELLEGGELFHQIVKLTYFSENLARHVILQVAHGIRYLHEERGVVHRDIKPENLLFERIPIIASKHPVQRQYDEDKEDEGEFIPGIGGGGIGRVKIADFGLSKVVWNEETMTPCGTVGYTAPEIVKDERYSKSVDMWATGCVLYTLLCGFPPFYDESINVLTEKVARGYYSFLSPWWDDISVSAKDLITHLLCIDPAQRYTIDEFLAHPWCNAAPAPPPPPTPRTMAPMDSPLLHSARGGRDGRSPGMASLKEAFDITYAVHRMEEEGARRRAYKGRGGAGMAGFLGGLNEDDEDDPDVSDDHGNPRQDHGPSREAYDGRAGQRDAPRRKNVAGFELSIDGATLLERRNRRGKNVNVEVGTIEAPQSPMRM
ncbi:hypothetical protein EW146_g1140 [Bondarzewia mesenterica]|uniref:Protein kinase domain-containing protein n=1 Tax=Bondarzewia mesenterica TaxID=1095465 RepID=A0A4S4M4Q4_9AGAM|nr:hypothetical protein EW146_g1140 [Bondarzewia mesenterica]